MTTGASDPTSDAESSSDAASVVDPNPDIDWAAAVALYVAATVTGVVGVAALSVEASSDVVLGLVPTTFTGGLLCGAIVARARPAAAVRLGALWWRTVALCLPAVILAVAVALFAAMGLVPGNWDLSLIGIALLGIGLPARLLALVARDAYVGTVIDRKRAATARWTWHQSGTNVAMLAIGLGLLALAVVLYYRLGQVSARILFAASLCVALGWDPTVSLPTAGDDAITVSPLPNMEYERGELRAYDVGLVFEPKLIPSYRRFVLADRISGVGLTEEKLVLERRFRPDIRCDRSEMDDIEGVLQSLEARERSRQSTV